MLYRDASSAELQTGSNIPNNIWALSIDVFLRWGEDAESIVPQGSSADQLLGCCQLDHWIPSCRYEARCQGDHSLGGSCTKEHHDNLICKRYFFFWVWKCCAHLPWLQRRNGVCKEEILCRRNQSTRKMAEDLLAAELQLRKKTSCSKSTHIPKHGAAARILPPKNLTARFGHFTSYQDI